MKRSKRKDLKVYCVYYSCEYDYIGETRDKGILVPERCRALTEYLRVTNNGEINPFSS